MNSENLFQSISDIDEDLIINADGYRFKKRKRKIFSYAVSVAAVFFLIILAGITIKYTDISLFLTTEEYGTAQNGDLTTDEKTNKSEENISTTETAEPQTSEAAIPSDTEIKPQTLAKASYPELSPYPDETEMNREKYTEMYNAWRDDILSLSSININSSAISSFSRKIAEELLTVKDTTNKVVSPLSVYMALSMLAETADGNSRQQILSLMGTDSLSALRSEAQNVWEKNYRNDGYLKSILANSLWLNDSVDFNNNTINILADRYYASVFRGTAGTASYNNLLNDWIKEQTDGLITPDLEMTPDTVMTLVSTILFNTKWTNEFNPEFTQNGIFHAATGEEECEFMRMSEAQMHYFWGDNFSAINLPLDIGGKMWFILPDEGTDVSKFFSDNEVWELITLEENRLNQEYEKSKYLRVNLSVPKFDISTKTDLKETLTELGITDIFDDTVSDFSPLSPNYKDIFINKVTHDVRVKIDEEGISAAAYTAIIYCGSSAPSADIVDFTLDRPFAFIITLDGTTPLFTGIVNSCL